MNYLLMAPENLLSIFVEAKVIKVPSFRTNSQVLKFIANLPASATVSDYIYDLDSGELYMEPGDTKIKLAKKNLKNKIDPREHILDPKEVENYYNIIKKPIKSIIDMDNTDPDVDLDSIVPVLISRTDIGKIQNYDIENIEEYLDDYKDELDLYGIEFLITPSNKRIKIDITFN